MATPRRIGAADSKTRAQLLDAAERLMLDQGYAAVTSRKLANAAGLKPQLVHYYFRTMDELFLELFRRRAEAGLARHTAALAGGQPLHLLWELSAHPELAALNIEFTALANHRKAVREEIAAYAERFRELNLAAIARVLERNRLWPGEIPPVVLLLAMTGLSVMLGMESILGITRGHAETVKFVQLHLDQLERPTTATKGSESAASAAVD